MIAYIVYPSESEYECVRDQQLLPKLQSKVTYIQHWNMLQSQGHANWQRDTEMNVCEWMMVVAKQITKQ